ncbi:tetratricopeptide repeat protein [Streptomyces fuscigenes]|uniref:tetratricopeptide repeat protein n=1 Tax=Streptomyces fuscigenes TaxID=1528880 RepID=UPI001F2046C6|nr:tetratricopeptide repeat protein [Streptomyces fuscigenes]MCF3961904.1 tetratricopeptide repeat protein [Streptomyces fuscigenes]
MATSPAVPNAAFRTLRGSRSAGEFAAAVRRAAREIGEQVACDARYVGRVESGEIRCPNYAYERVFLHMFPGKSLADLGFFAREAVRGRGVRARAARPGDPDRAAPPAAPGTASGGQHPVFVPLYEGSGRRDRPERHGGGSGAPDGRADPDHPDHPDDPHDPHDPDEESDMLRRAFMASGSAGAAFAPLSVPAPRNGSPGRVRLGEPEVRAVEDEVRRIRLLDDRHGADGLFRRATGPLQAAYALLDSGHVAGRSLSDRLHAGAGELALSVGWLAHDSGRFEQARSHYAEALATARVSDDAALEAHAFCNTAFLADDAGRHREAVRAAQAGRRAAARLASPRLMSLLALREAAGWAGLGDRSATTANLTRAHALFERGPSDGDPEWMSFFGEPELAWLDARCHAALGDWPRAARHAYRATALQDERFARNLALYRVELATALARSGSPDEAAAAGQAALDLLQDVTSSRIRGMLATTVRVLLPQRRAQGVDAFLARSGAGPARPL